MKKMLRGIIYSKHNNKNITFPNMIHDENISLDRKDTWASI